jgi:hypothetical protein
MSIMETPVRAFVVEYGSKRRRRAAILGQKRRVHVKAAVFGEVEHDLGNYLGVGGGDEHVPLGIL